MKIALYLGSFNPFHNGHLEVVKQAFNDFKMDVVVIVPTMKNPWKKEEPLSMDGRVGIIHTSLTLIPFMYSSRKDYCSLIYFPKNKSHLVKIDKIEESLMPPYYSYATLHALKNKYCTHEVFVLCGEDTIKSIPDWMNGGEIIKNYDFLVCDRPENSISSTEIRDKIKNGEDISNLVNVNVINLIKKYYK